MATSISTTAEMPDNLQTFTCFPTLPKELQLQIWEAVDEGRNFIRISTAKDKNGSTGILTASYKIPARLHVCKDSRDVALKTYKQLFQQELQYEAQSQSRVPQYVFFNLNSDILSFADDEAETVFTCIVPNNADWRSIRYVAIDHAQNSDPIVSYCRAIYYSRMPNLEHIYLVTGSAVHSQIHQDLELEWSMHQETLAKLKDCLVRYSGWLHVDDWKKSKKGSGQDVVGVLPCHTVLYEDEFLESVCKV